MLKILTTLSLVIAIAPMCLAVGAPVSATELSKATGMQRCMEKRTCRFHIVGALASNPRGVFSIFPQEWERFSEDDKAAAQEFAKLWLDHVHDNPGQALVDKRQGAGINADAPILPTMARNVSANLSTVEFLVASSKMKDGSPGWSEGSTINEMKVRYTPGR